MRSYWERAATGRNNLLVFLVYVPRQGVLPALKKGCGIVGLALDGRAQGQSLVYYEAATEDQAYEDLLHKAADMMAVGFPTVGRAVAATDDLLAVGYTRRDRRLFG